jgi:hypothetical protein
MLDIRAKKHVGPYVKRSLLTENWKYHFVKLSSTKFHR